MMRTLHNTGIILLLSLMVSCGRAKQPTVATITPTDKPSVVESTEQPSPVPTETGLPTQVATPPVENLLGDCWLPTGLDSQVSPDEQWIAAPCDLGETSHLRIINKQEMNAWEPAFQEITGIPPCLAFINGFGEQSCFDGILHIHHWAKDSRYVFVNVDFVIDRAYDFSYGLYRLDVETHQISPWLKSTSDYTYRYAFSPNNENLAYVSSAEANTFYVNSIATGQVASYKIPGQVKDIAYLTWSPDNQKLAFSILHEGWSDNTGGFSVALLDLEKGKVSILLPEDNRLFYPIDWSSDTVIELSNRTGLPDHQYDLQSNELSQIP